MILCHLQDLNAYKKQGMALLSRVGESVKHVTGGYKLRSRPLEFAAIGDYLDTFALKLGTIDRIAQRIIKEEIGELFVETRGAQSGGDGVYIYRAEANCRNAAVAEPGLVLLKIQTQRGSKLLNSESTPSPCPASLHTLF